MKVIAETCLAL